MDRRGGADVQHDSIPERSRNGPGGGEWRTRRDVLRHWSRDGRERTGRGHQGGGRQHRGTDRVHRRGELASAWDSADPVASLRGFAAAGGRPVRIATFPEGSVPHTVLLYWLSERLGIDTATRDEFVEIVPMGADQVQQALLAGQVDGASILEPTLTIVRELAPETRVLARAPEMFPGQPGAVLAVRESVIRDHPEAVQRLVDLHVRATEFLNTRPEESARHALAYIGAGLVEVETLEAAITSPSTNYTADPREIVEPTRRMHDFQLAQGSLAQPVDLDALFESRFYEAAVAE